MRIAIEHVTRYRYAAEASYSVQSLRLTPARFEGHDVVDWSLAVEPSACLVATRDGFGNPIHLATVAGPHREVVIRARGVVEVCDRSGVVQGLSDSVPSRIFLRRTPLTMPDRHIDTIARETAGLSAVPRLHAIMGAIRDKVDYRIGTTSAATTASEALAAGEGVCQDHAHIFISACRAAGVPARYVTGYLLMQDAGPETHEAHHAWAEAWVDGLGWLGFDVANRICPTDHYVRMASALDAYYAAPVRGTRRGGEAERLEVAVLVQQASAQQ